jgi:hypothetical protein
MSELPREVPSPVGPWARLIRFESGPGGAPAWPRVNATLTHARSPAGPRYDGRKVKQDSSDAADVIATAGLGPVQRGVGRAEHGFARQVAAPGRRGDNRRIVIDCPPPPARLLVVRRMGEPLLERS